VDASPQRALVTRHRWQGLASVLRFNWPVFTGAGLLVLALLAAASWLANPLGAWVWLPALGALGALLLSLLATAYAYDLGGLYRLGWLDPHLEGVDRAANVHAGFDETSILLRHRYPNLELAILDFHDPERHTEPSIARARRVAPSPPGTLAANSDALPLPSSSQPRILVILAAHEIRDPGERTRFLAELRRCLARDGRILLVEHLRDLANVVAYQFGAWHFHSRADWLTRFREAGLVPVGERRLNRLITCFELRRDDDPA